MSEYAYIGGIDIISTDGRPGNEMTVVLYLAANGTREWKNKMMLKAKRTTAPLSVLEYVVGDEHTFDIWVQWTAPNGKIKAVRPKLVAWEDIKSRRIVGDIMCVDANSQTLKESLVKMIYLDGVPKYLHVDNGKDYTGKAMTGQSRAERKIDFDLDSETVGFSVASGADEITLKDDAIKLADTTITETFLDTTPQEIIRYMLSKSGISSMSLLTDDFPTLKRVGIYRHSALLGIDDVHTAWGINYPSFFRNGTFYWGTAPAQTKIYTFEYGVNIISLSRSSDVWELETLSAPFVRHSQQIKIIHPQITGTFTVLSVIFKTNEDGFVRTTIRFAYRGMTSTMRVMFPARQLRSTAQSINVDS